MKLTTLIGIRSEVTDVLEKYRENYQIVLADSLVELEAELHKFATEPGRSDADTYADTLLVAATEATGRWGPEHGIATMAYANPLFAGESLSGVDMVVEGFEEVEPFFLEKVYQRCHHIPWEIARTARCIIRELTLEDMDALFELYKDEEITRYTEKLCSKEEEQEFQRAYIDHMYRFYGYGMWLVFSQETGELIGRAGLEHREYNGQTELELGYVIGKPYQRQGYATEVCERIIEVAKNITDFPRINCLIDAENLASLGLVEKLGFEFAEDMEDHGRVMKRYISTIM